MYAQVISRKDTEGDPSTVRFACQECAFLTLDQTQPAFLPSVLACYPAGSAVCYRGCRSRHRTLPFPLVTRASCVMRKSRSAEFCISSTLILYSSCLFLATSVQVRLVVHIAQSNHPGACPFDIHNNAKSHLSMMQGFADTARTSVLLHLGPSTATQPEQTTLPTLSPVNLTFEYPVGGQHY